MQRVIDQTSLGRFGNAEVDDFCYRQAVMHRHEDVGWLDVAMDDSSLMCVLNRLANLNEEAESLWNSHATLHAVLGNPDATDQLHYEVRAPFRRCTCIEYLRNVWMV